MNICFLHIRISISSGHITPDILFRAPCVAPDGISIHSNLLEVEDTEKPWFQDASPLKPCKRKFQACPEIDFKGLDDISFKEFVLKLKGLRNAHEIIVETYSNILFEQNTSSEDTTLFEMSSHQEKSHSPADSVKSDNSPKKGRASKTPPSGKQNVSHKEANKQLRMSDNKEGRCTPSEDNELSEIFDTTSRSKQVNSRPGSSTDFRTLSPLSPTGYKIPFFCGNPAVEITNGIIHIYKSHSKLSVSEESPPPETDTLCLLAVPAAIDVHGLMEFTAPFMEVIMRMRVIRDRTPNQYMALLTFMSPKDARDFFFNLNNQPFSSLVPDEICHMAFVASVEATFPYNRETDTGTAFLPLSNCEELPDCMVCLERMDESVRGILTILCNHSFHGACLIQWEDMCCPVCRYVQTPELQSSNKCMVCGGVEDLWICLVCGHVGCGRYTSEHAQRHYLETHHNYAMALSDNRVWDYAGDYFVHRLFQNKEDGKLVEKKGDLTSEGQEAKVEAIQLECMHLLTSQLESQRKYWEEQVARTERKAGRDLEALDSQLKQVTERERDLQDTLKSCEKDKQSLTDRNKVMATRLYEALKDLQTEREFNRGLVQNQDEWKAKVAALEERGVKQQEEIGELKEQLRDVMFFIEAGQTIRNSGESVQEEIREGQVTVGEASSSSGAKRRGRGNKEK